MSGKEANQEQIPCPKCGNRVQRRYMRKHDRNMHQGARRLRHACPYCSAEKAKTYSTFLDWRNHLQDTHEHCLEDDDSLQREAAPLCDRLVEMSTSDHGRSGQGRRSRSREPTPPQLMNISIDDFTLVSHTTDSFTFTSAHPFFPGWVRVVGAHRNDRVRGTSCASNPKKELRAKRRVRRDVEPSEVRRFLRQELLRKLGHSWWNRPRVYCHDLADERELTPSLRSVVVIPSDPEQPEVSPEQQGLGPSGSSDRMTLVGPVASPITSLPRTLGQEILLPGDAEESPRTRDGQEQEMGRRSVAAAIRPIKDRAVASSSSATEPIIQEMVAEACDTLVRERHPASPPVWPEGSKHLT